MGQHVLRLFNAKATTVKCPACGDVVVYYYGNYLCNSSDVAKRDPGTKEVTIIPGACNWALPYPVYGKKNKNVADALYRAGDMSETEYFS